MITKPNDATQQAAIEVAAAIDDLANAGGSRDAVTASLLRFVKLAYLDEHIGWENEDQEEAGDYVARLKQVGEQLAAAQQVAALSEAERRVIDSACARLEYHNTISAFAHWSRAEKQKVNDLDSALDGAAEALLALRAAGGETEHG